MHRKTPNRKSAAMPKRLWSTQAQNLRNQRWRQLSQHRKPPRRQPLNRQRQQMMHHNPKQNAPP
jgi:hypothetical protein